MADSDGTSNEHHHDAGVHCARCGHALRVERAYKVNDRLMQLLLVAIARSMGLDVYRKGRKNSPTIYVASSDAGSLDRYDARVGELSARLEAELVTVTLAFVKQHTGIELKLGA